MKKSNKDLCVGDNIKEKSLKLRRRVGQIISILEDNPSNPTLECIAIHPKTLLPSENIFGEFRRFKIKRNNVKYYVPRHKLFKKKTFSVGGFCSYRGATRIRYGRIMGYLNREEGLYPHSYDLQEHNGKDLLQCVEINPDNLKRILDADNHPNIFIADPNKCKVVDVLDKDENGNTIIARKLDI